MTHKQAAFAAATENIIKNLEKRGMEGYFFEDLRFLYRCHPRLYPEAASFHGAAANPSRKPG